MRPEPSTVVRAPGEQAIHLEIEMLVTQSAFVCCLVFFSFDFFRLFFLLVRFLSNPITLPDVSKFGWDALATRPPLPSRPFPLKKRLESE